MPGVHSHRDRISGEFTRLFARIAECIQPGSNGVAQSTPRSETITVALPGGNEKKAEVVMSSAEVGYVLGRRFVKTAAPGFLDTVKDYGRQAYGFAQDNPLAVGGAALGGGAGLLSVLISRMLDKNRRRRNPLLELLGGAALGVGAGGLAGYGAGKYGPDIMGGVRGIGEGVTGTAGRAATAARDALDKARAAVRPKKSKDDEVSAR